MSRLLPFLLFIAMAALLAVGLRIADKKTELPSPLIDKPAPTFSLPVLGAPDQQLSSEQLLGQAYVLNVWASWCPPCRLEHATVGRLAALQLAPVIGLNYKDEADDAQRWLAELGNPYSSVIADLDGNVAIDFGVVAAPETFIIDAQGKVRYKHIGALDDAILEQQLLPALKALIDE